MSAPALDYPTAVAELRRRGRFGVSLGLERVAAILDAVGNPQRQLHGALVAGTNGKGSVIALARAALADAGARVGTMPKPHLVSYRERIAIDGVPVSRERFAAAISAVLPAVDAVAERLGPPTEFEVLTAAAFAELTREPVELALVEVGLGGRLDATNVLDPGVSAITTVEHDHERHLGRTLAAIGAEKAAIIKAGSLAVTGARGNGLVPVLERCRALDVPLRRAGRGQPYAAELLEAGWDGLTIRVRTPHGDLDGLRVGLLGRHQATNAAVAVALLDALGEDAARRGAPWRLTEESLRAGFAAARWPGRLELLRSTPLGDVLLDGAHNPAGARALAAALGDLGLRGAPLVFGATRGKRVTAVLRALAPLAPRPVFTTFRGGPAVSTAALHRAWQRVAGTPAEVVATPHEAVARAAELRTTATQPVVVAGSLYLVGAVRGMLTGQEEDG